MTGSLKGIEVTTLFVHGLLMYYCRISGLYLLYVFIIHAHKVYKRSTSVCTAFSCNVYIYICTYDTASVIPSLLYADGTWSWSRFCGLFLLYYSRTISSFLLLLLFRYFSTSTPVQYVQTAPHVMLAKRARLITRKASKESIDRRTTGSALLYAHVPSQMRW
jgi:hypothetical protein